LDDAVSSTWILGRGAACEDDAAPRAIFVRPCPGRAAFDAGPLTGAGMSRKQLRLRVSSGALEVTSIAQPVLALDGHPVDAGVTRRIAPGTVVSIRSHSVFR
jgi:hypothetical protein